jgi:hypothetical protein
MIAEHANSKATSGVRSSLPSPPGTTEATGSVK